MKRRTKTKFWTKLAIWQYDLCYAIDNIGIRLRKFYRRYFERGAIIIAVVLFLGIFWSSLIYLAFKILDLIKELD